MNQNPSSPHRDDWEECELGTDAQWSEMRELLRAADRPPMPDLRHFAAMRASVLQRCAQERRSWFLRLVDQLGATYERLMSPGPLAGTLRMAAAAGIGAILAISTLKPSNALMDSNPSRISPAASSEGGKSIALASAAKHSSLSTGKEGEQAQPGTDTEPEEAREAREAREAGDEPVGELMASLTATPLVSPSEGMIVPKSAVASSAQAGNLARAENAAGGNQGDVAMLSADPSGAQAIPVRAPTSLTAPAGSKLSAAASASDPSATAMIEAIGRLKLNLYLSGEERFRTDVQKLETAMVDVLERGNGASGANDPVKALQLFRQAESAAQERRFSNAISAYSQVAKNGEGGGSKNLLAFMAHLKIADIEFEQLNDYGSALEEYQICMTNYTSFLSEERKTRILQRVDLLTRTSENNWEPLRLYREGQKSTAPVAALRYLDLLERYPENLMAGPSAQALAELAASDASGQQVDVDRAMQVMQQVLARARSNSTPSSPAAAVQFALADIFQRRLFNPRQAAVQFNEVLKLNPSPELTASARNRLQDLYQQRAVTPTP